MSCGYLNAALDGVFGSHLIGLHKAFFDLSRVSLLQAMVRVKKHGSTSGVEHFSRRFFQLSNGPRRV